MSVVCRSGKKLSELVRPLKIYFNTPEINLKIKNVEQGNLILKMVEKEFKKEKILRIDGITVESKGWWFNLRKSNTEPLVRLRAEANTNEKLEEIKEKVIGIINSV